MREPVSHAISLINRERTGNFRKIRRRCDGTRSFNTDDTGINRRIPYAMEQGIFLAEQGTECGVQGFDPHDQAIALHRVLSSPASASCAADAQSDRTLERQQQRRSFGAAVFVCAPWQGMSASGQNPKWRQAHDMSAVGRKAKEPASSAAKSSRKPGLAVSARRSGVERGVTKRERRRTFRAERREELRYPGEQRVERSELIGV